MPILQHLHMCICYRIHVSKCPSLSARELKHCSAPRLPMAHLLSWASSSFGGICTSVRILCLAGWLNNAHSQGSFIPAPLMCHSQHWGNIIDHDTERWSDSPCNNICSYGVKHFAKRHLRVLWGTQSVPRVFCGPSGALKNVHIHSKRKNIYSHNLFPPCISTLNTIAARWVCYTCAHTVLAFKSYKKATIKYSGLILARFQNPHLGCVVKTNIKVAVKTFWKY